MLIASTMLTLVTGCQSGAGTDTFCLTSQAIRPSRAQIASMTDAQIRQTLAHNEYGAKRCGWKA